MTIKKLSDIKARRGFLYGARVIVTKDSILKNRTEELNGLLGRIKEYLREDEVLLIAHNDVIDKLSKDNVKGEPAPTIDFKNIWEKALRQPAVITPLEPQPEVTTTGGYTTTTRTWVTNMGYNTYVHNTNNTL